MGDCGSSNQRTGGWIPGSSIVHVDGTAVQAGGPSWGGFGVGRRRLHMHSNSSMRCLVFPDRICRRVLYLSRPAFMFSAWIMSFTVFLLSSRAMASSELRAWGGQAQRVVIGSGRSFFSASVMRSSSLRSLYVLAAPNSALASALLSSFSSCSFSALRGSWTSSCTVVA
ncbi:hypothetical protein EYF80_010475 [Liparis tanakae]|uniref:Uncharacterized protein n=1 Tax=Liparis tanakae TaxID=230148 RepID=A0A4Z2IN72_9TELE|nr:hypothetical protein EYF80_010475 [Liparis tanakae]